MSEIADFQTGVHVELADSAFLGAHIRRSHPTGVRWRVTKKQRLVILDGTGNEIARYKEGRWLSVWREFPVV